MGGLWEGGRDSEFKVRKAGCGIRASASDSLWVPTPDSLEPGELTQSSPHRSSHHTTVQPPTGSELSVLATAAL